MSDTLLQRRKRKIGSSSCQQQTKYGTADSNGKMRVRADTGRKPAIEPMAAVNGIHNCAVAELCPELWGG